MIWIGDYWRNAMRRILLAISVSVGPSTLLLSGCAGYDRFAEPNASLALTHALEHCAFSLPANDPRKYSDLTACQLAAERDFALATHMRRMDVFDIYARDMRQIGADLDAKTLAPGEAIARTSDIRQAYLAKCDCTLGQTRPRWGMDIPSPAESPGAP
jgi:hypothetical protein